MPLDDKLAFGLTINELPSVNSGDADAFLAYLVDALGLASSRSSRQTAMQLLKLFILASKKKSGFIDSGVHELEVIDGGLKISSIANWLKANEAGVGISQLYSNYLSAFIRAGIITKRKYSAYGLKAGSLQATLKDIELDLKKEFGKALDHAVKLDLILLP